MNLQDGYKSVCLVATRAREIAPSAMAILIALAGSCSIAHAQQARTTPDGLEVLQVKPGFYLIGGAGGNIGVQIGPDGIVVAGSGLADKADQVLAAIKKLSDEPIRYIMNTSADADQVGGNEKLSKAGRTLLPLADTLGVDLAMVMTAGGSAPILAPEQVLLRMSAPTGKQASFPSASWPSETFSAQRKILYLNGEAVEMIREPAAHTDGDSFVFFRRTDVIMAGDILDTTHFPVIDTARAGTIQGELDALNRLVELTVPPVPFVWREGGTYVVAGHGRICEQSDVVEYRDMVTIISDIVQDMVKRGMTLAQIQAADPAKAYRKQYGSDTGPWTTNAFIEAIYKGLAGKN